MKEGTFKAVVADWGVSKSKERQTPSVNVEFSVDVEGNLESITWFGYLTEAAKDRTIETLYKLGFNGDLFGLAAGRQSSCLDGGKEVILTISLEMYNGEPKYKVKWVNLPGESHGIPKLESSEGLSVLQQFKADFLRLKPKEQPTQSKNPQDEIGF